MVMEFINGRNLGDVIRERHDQGQRLPLDETLAIAGQIGAALAYAHRQGIVHRDVKPTNVLVDDSGRVILADFGLVKILSGTKYTASGALLGTPAYMAPEQCLGEAGDARTDLYALGIILYELAVGRLPFVADTTVALLLQQVNYPPPPPLSLNPGLPAWLEKIILKALEKNPADRYQTVDDLLADLAGQRHPARPQQLATPVDARLPVEMQRKQATLLFCDVVGSTQIGLHLDPEDVVEIMNGALQRLGAVIEAHGGRVLRFMGDGLKAIFGAPVAREDDAERAVRAGLVILETAQSYAQELETQWHLDNFQVRVGINTGLVALGEGVEGSNTAMGAAVNLAARMESAAPSGSLLISHDTFQHVRGLFDLQRLEPIQVKGVGELVPVYIVQRARPRAFRLGRRGVEGIHTRMIGREAQLKALQDTFYAVTEEGERQMITLSGEAGVGKSRLLDEFINWLDLLPQSVYYFKGRARQEMQNLPYALLRDLFAFRFQIQESDPVTQVWQKMEQGIAEALGEGDQSQMKAYILGQLLGFDFSDSLHLEGIFQDAQQLRDRALVYLTDYFKAMSVRQPVVILLEDIHWADSSSLDVLNQLALATMQQQLLIVGATRPELWERRPHWGEGQSWHARHILPPLSRRESHRLVEEILQKVADLPETLRNLIVAKAEGNPYYVEELIKMLIEEGVIVKGDDVWLVEPARLANVRVPPTLTDILQARLDSLAPVEKAELQRASVVGRIFWDEVVAQLDQTPEAKSEDKTAALRNTLYALRNREMIFQREPAAFSGTQEYIFKHALLREVTYESVLKRLRRAYHARVADWLITRGRERMDEYTGLIADHLEQAGRMEETITYLRRASEQAAARFANTEALEYLSRALALIPATDVAERYDLLLDREAIYNLLGARELQVQDLNALEALAEALDDDRRRAVAEQRRASYASQTGDYATALARLEQCLAIAQSLDDPAIEGSIRCDLGIIATRQGNYPTALVQLGQSLAIVRAIGDRAMEDTVLRTLGIVAWYQGNYAEAQTYYKQSLAIARLIGNRRSESYVLGNLGLVASNRGNYAGARAYHEQSLATSRAIGDRAAEGRTLNNLGEVAMSIGDFTGACAYFEQSLALSRAIGNRPSENLTLLNLGEVALSQTEYTEARAYFEQVLTIARAVGVRLQEGGALTGLGDTALGEGRLNDASSYYEQSQALLRELGQSGRALVSTAGLAQVALAQGDLSQALAQVETILASLENNGALNRADELLRVYLICYRILRANHEARASAILNTAYKLLQERAGCIPEESVRLSFLYNVPGNREIVEAYDGLRN